YSGLNIGGKSYFHTPVHPHVAHRDSRGRNVAYEPTEFTSGKEIKQAAGNAGIGLTYANETPFFHFDDYRTAASNDLPGAPAAKTIRITHSESYRTR
ncbi:Tat pathway signal sequence, partial [Faecalibacterium sp. DFI.5.82]|nr:Tat pathway signal sequence [Faecalibacterium sp. DFI.5.82]